MVHETMEVPPIVRLHQTQPLVKGVSPPQQPRRLRRYWDRHSPPLGSEQCLWPRPSIVTRRSMNP